MKRILFTGGGSAGHVSVNLALIPGFLDMGWEVSYMGSLNGIESRMIGELPGVRYVGIATGKLRRYLDWQNIKDPFRVIRGSFQAYRAIKRRKPDVVFSKGGFVAVPVVIGAWLNQVPVIIHESDFTPGLANRISIPFADKVLLTFPETGEAVKKQKAMYIGAIVREQLKQGKAVRGLNLCRFTSAKPVIVVMGGSLGSQKINEAVRSHLPALIKHFQIVHICGKDQVDASLAYREYRQFEFVKEELADILAMADMVVSRAGSNSIFEFLALRKPMLLIPLSKKASRGDQILNAQSFHKSGYCEILYEEDMKGDAFLAAVLHVYEKRSEMTDRMNQSHLKDPIARVTELIKQTARST